MFSSFLGELKGYFGKAFVLAVWLPILLFTSAGLAVYLAGAGILRVSWERWLGLQIEDKVLLAAAFLITVTLTAFVIDHMQVPITRMFEGYWDDVTGLRAFGRFKRRRCERQLNLLDARLEVLAEEIPTLEQNGRHAGLLKAEFNRLTERRLLSFPPPGYEAQLMPTRIGNIYKAAELYPYTRYRIDTVIVWPRLRQVLPDGFVGRMQEVKTAADFLLLFGLLAIIFSLASLVYLIAQGAVMSLIVICALGLPLGWLSYRASLAPARGYAEMIKVAFDLYRQPLLKSLGLELPTTLSEEQKLWRELSIFIFRGVPPAKDWQFTPPKP